MREFKNSNTTTKKVFILGHFWLKSTSPLLGPPPARRWPASRKVVGSVRELLAIADQPSRLLDRPAVVHSVFAHADTSLGGSNDKRNTQDTSLERASLWVWYARHTNKVSWNPKGICRDPRGTPSAMQQPDHSRASSSLIYQPCNNNEEEREAAIDEIERIKCLVDMFF